MLTFFHSFLYDPQVFWFTIAVAVWSGAVIYLAWNNSK